MNLHAIDLKKEFKIKQRKVITDTRAKDKQRAQSL